MVLVAAAAGHAGGASLVFPPYGHSFGIRKATSAHLLVFFGLATWFDDPQGIAAAKMVSRDDPATSSDDDEVVVYGVNAGRNELIYNTTMWTLGRYGGLAGDGFRHPRGVAADRWGNVFVADSGNNRIVHLFNPKRHVRWLRSYTGRSPSDAGLQGPSQVAFDEDGLLYVSDTRNRRIAVLDTSGRIVRAMRPDAGFSGGPTTVAFADGRSAPSYFKEERALFCADSNGRRLWKFSPAGHVLGSAGMPAGHQANYGAVDFYHNLWVTDTRRHCILKFTHDLALCDVFGAYGSGDGQFDQPRGIAIWKRFGQTFIAERSGAQYYWVGSDCRGASLACDSSAGCRLSVDLTEYSYVSMFGCRGTDTNYLFVKKFLPPLRTQIALPQGLGREPGSFTLRVEPTYSSYLYNAWHFPVTAAQ